MARFQMTINLVLSAALSFAAMGASAQSNDEMTAEEITEAFKKQKTRGLVIVPSGVEPGVGSETAEIVAAASEKYSAVDADEQVNIQISFDFDSAALREDQKDKLATLCTVMKSIDVSVFQIIGHTDSSGKASYNKRLSLLRAQEVKRHIVNECGIAEDRLNALGLGESAPLNPDDPRGDANRRVEFQALG